jgi:hypothetical protein
MIEAIETRVMRLLKSLLILEVLVMSEYSPKITQAVKKKILENRPAILGDLLKESILMSRKLLRF